MHVHASPEPPRSDNGHRVIDCDVHPYVAGGVETIYPYLSPGWRKRFERKRAGLSNSNLTLRFQHPNGSAIRADAAPIKGSVGGSDVGFMCRQLLDEHGVDAAILNCLQTGALAATLAGPEESVVLTAAFNDFFLDKWMPVDPRLKFAMSVPVQDPQQAAREIRRIGRNTQICAVSLPPLNILMGNRYYWPIYKAAQAGFRSSRTSPGPIPFTWPTDVRGRHSGILLRALRHAVAGGGVQRQQPRIHRDAGAVSRLEVHFRRVRVLLAAAADLANAKDVARIAPRGAVGEKISDRICSRPDAVHHAAHRRAAESARPRQDDRAHGLRPALLHDRLSALGQRHARADAARSLSADRRRKSLRQRARSAPGCDVHEFSPKV